MDNLKVVDIYVRFTRNIKRNGTSSIHITSLVHTMHNSRGHFIWNWMDWIWGRL